MGGIVLTLHDIRYTGGIIKCCITLGNGSTHGAAILRESEMPFALLCWWWAILPHVVPTARPNCQPATSNSVKL